MEYDKWRQESEKDEWSRKKQTNRTIPINSSKRATCFANVCSVCMRASEWLLPDILIWLCNAFCESNRYQRQSMSNECRIPLNWVDTAVPIGNIQHLSLSSFCFFSIIVFCINFVIFHFRSNELSHMFLFCVQISVISFNACAHTRAIHAAIPFKWKWKWNEKKKKKKKNRNIRRKTINIHSIVKFIIWHSVILCSLAHSELDISRYALAAVCECVSYIHVFDEKNSVLLFVDCWR